MITSDGEASGRAERAAPGPREAPGKKRLKTSGREDAWHWAGEKKRRCGPGSAGSGAEMRRGTGDGMAS